MIYSLLLSNGETYSLNGPEGTFSLRQSMTLEDLTSSKESNLIPRSYGDGSVKVGASRMAQAQISLSADIAFATDAVCRGYINGLFAALKNAEYLVDETSGIRTRVDLASQAVTWDDGCYFRSGTVSVLLNQLVPYWESTVPESVSMSVDPGVPTTLNVTNPGFSDTPFTLRVDVGEQPEAVEFVELQNSAQGSALIVKSAMLGLSNFTSLEVNGEEGSAKLLNFEDGTELDVQNAFEPGSGYFDLSVGVNRLDLRCSVAATFVMSYRARFFT